MPSEQLAELEGVILLGEAFFLPMSMCCLWETMSAQGKARTADVALLSAMIHI
jgi:hypothetical protein